MTVGECFLFCWKVFQQLFRPLTSSSRHGQKEDSREMLGQRRPSRHLDFNCVFLSFFACSENLLFKQINDVAMGTTMGPIYANLFVGFIEHHFFNQYFYFVVFHVSMH